MRKFGEIVFVIACVAGLTACGQPVQGAGATATEPSSAAVAPAKITAEAVPSQVVDEAMPTPGPDEYLKNIKSKNWGDQTPTDEALLAAGYLACEQKLDGATYADIDVIDFPGNSKQEKDMNAIIGNVAVFNLCVEADPDLSDLP